MSDELLPSDLMAQARAMWSTAMWQSVVGYLIQRRESLLAAVDPPPDVRAVWIREGAVAELNRILRGDAFLAEVIRQAQQRRGVDPETADAPPPPPWMKQFQSDVVD